MDNTKRKMSSIKILLVIICCLLFLAVGYYLVFTLEIFKKSGYEQGDENKIQQEETPIESEDEPNTEYYLFTGEYISASLPSGWRIEEYEDGKGSEMLTPGETYSGLTGLRIFNGDTQMFYMQAVSGLGFAGCPNYAKFLDESTSYYEQTLTDNEISGEELNIRDFTSTPYAEFKWFGVPFRRIEKTYIYDVKPGNQYFESSCVFTLVSFYDLTLYRIDGKYGSSAYDFGATQSATEVELKLIDGILGSMTLLY